MNKQYRVIDNTDVSWLGVEVRDYCTLVDDQKICAWFRNDNWRGDGIWSLCGLWLKK